jgi:hypothetical protein
MMALIGDFPNGYYGTTTGASTHIPVNTAGIRQTSQATRNVTTFVQSDGLIATEVCRMPNGNIRLKNGNIAMEIPPALFKDLFAFAEMGLLEKLCPEIPDAE